MEQTDDNGLERGRARPHRPWLALAVLLTAAFGLALFASGRQYVADMLPKPPAVAPVGAEPTLTVVVARTAGGPEEWMSYERVLSYLSRKLGRRIETRFVAKEEMAPKAVEDGGDLAFVCAHTYVTLEKKGVVKGIATARIRERTTTTQMLIVASKSRFESLADLKGSRIGVADKSALGGYAYLSVLAIEGGWDPEAYFSEVATGDTQEHYVSEVLAGRLDATVVSRAQLSPETLARFRVIRESPEIGLPPVVVRTSLDASTTTRITELLLSPEVRSVLGTSALDGFAPLEPKDYTFAEELSSACSLKEHKR